MAHAACSMPDHGRVDAPHACCRPPITAAAPPAVTSRRGSWSDLGLWLRAARATAHCLFGCALGDIAVMTLLPLVWPEVPQRLLIGLAIVGGLASSLALETLMLRLRERIAWRRALSMALGMSLVSMLVMELAMNTVDWLAMGGVRLPLHHPGFWLAWIPGLAAGFVVPLPYNYLMLRRHGRACH